MLLEQDPCFVATFISDCGLDVTGSSGWQGSKGRLPEEDYSWRLLWDEVSKWSRYIFKKEKSGISRLLMTWFQCLDPWGFSYCQSHLPKVSTCRPNVKQLPWHRGVSIKNSVSCSRTEVCRSLWSTGSLLHVGISIISQSQWLQSVIHLPPLRPLWLFAAEQTEGISQKKLITCMNNILTVRNSKRWVMVLIKLSPIFFL